MQDEREPPRHFDSEARFELAEFEALACAGNIDIGPADEIQLWGAAEFWLRPKTDDWFTTSDIATIRLAEKQILELRKALGIHRKLFTDMYSTCHFEGEDVHFTPEHYDALVESLVRFADLIEALFPLLLAYVSAGGLLTLPSNEDSEEVAAEKPLVRFVRLFVRTVRKMAKGSRFENPEQRERAENLLARADKSTSGLVRLLRRSVREYRQIP